MLRPFVPEGCASAQALLTRHQAHLGGAERAYVPGANVRSAALSGDQIWSLACHL